MALELGFGWDLIIFAVEFAALLYALWAVLTSGPGGLLPSF